MIGCHGECGSSKNYGNDNHGDEDYYGDCNEYGVIAADNDSGDGGRGIQLIWGNCRKASMAICDATGVDCG